MREELLLVLAATFFILSLGIILRFTGFGTLTAITIRVLERTAGKITIDYSPEVEVGSTQKIYAEFTNIGNTPTSARIEIKIHAFLNNTLKLLANYYDSTVQVPPGGKRGFRVLFVPPEATIYYIQARAYYGARVVETWGVFRAYYKIVEHYKPVPYEVPAGTILVPVRVGMSLKYTERIRLMPGDTVLADVTVINTGDAPLNNIRIYLSISSLLNFSVSGKQLGRLQPNSSAIFLITIEAPENIQPGEYPLEFEVISDETKQSGKITVEVLSIPIPEDEVIKNTILNYEYLINEIEKEINDFRQQGYDVTLSNQSLSMAKQFLKSAKENYKKGLFDKAKEDLQRTRKYLEDAVFQLANATLYFYAPPAFVPYWLIAVIFALAGFLLLVFYYRRKRKEKRPKLLREMAEETEK